MGLEGLDAAQFLSHHWQKKPLLLRAGLNIPTPISPEELAGLALEAHIESRVVECRPDGFVAQQGPFNEAFFTRAFEHPWTLLVQAVDLWLPRTAHLLSVIDFLPPWRLDDLMVSYATAHGSAGPHFDHYDVFLIQASGHKTWHIGQTCDDTTALNTQGGMKIMREFDEQDCYHLEPGDVLYLPPKVAHWGIAEDDSITYSIGFRAPTVAEALYDLAIELDAMGDGTLIRDPELSLSMANEHIDGRYVESVQAQLQSALNNTDLLGDWLARYMSQPKYPEATELSNEQRVAVFRSRRYVNGDPD
jgi:50S ribosomal protein L16 3-hydroxylase